MISTKEIKLAALITCETFAPYCSDMITYLDIDNTSARAWLDKARSPKFPFDRCGQGTHLFMLEKNMKIITNRLGSSANALADRCSREAFSMRVTGHDFGRVRLCKVKPRWQTVAKCL